MDPVARAAAALDAARAGEAVHAEILADVSLDGLEEADRAAFWLNVYNARVRSGLREQGLTGNLRTHRGFFGTGWVVSGRFVSLHTIEHGLLRGNRPAPWTFWRPMRSGDPRLAWGVPLDPRFHFALNCGARSCPPIRSYRADRLDAQLTLATRAYLDGEVAVEGDALRLPYLCHLYRRDFPDVRAFVADHVDEERAEWIRAHPQARLRWGRYHWEIV